MKHFAFATALLLITSDVVSQSKDWLALPLGPAQDLVLETSGDRTARIPVRPADGASAPKTPLQVRLFDVSSKAGRGLKLADQFTVKLVDASSIKDAAIEVVVAKGASEVLPGPHALSLKISPDFDDPKSIQTLSVTLTVPTPQISVDPVLVGIDRGFLWFTDTVNKGELRVTETGGKSPAQALNLTFARDPAVTGQPESGGISFGAGIGAVPAGGVVSAPVFAERDFSPGEATGKIEIRSRDLAAPVTTTFKVRTRRSLVWIFVVVAAGSVVGYFVRNSLTKRKALLEASAVASGAVGLVNTEMASTADPTYIAELKGLRETMREPVVTKNAGEINKKATKLQEDLISARARFELRLQPLTQGAVALHNLADKEWPVPPYVLASLQALRLATLELSRALAQRNADDAKEILEERVSPLLLAALKAVDIAGANVGRLAETVVADAPPLAGRDLAHLTTATDAFAKRFPMPSPERVDATVDQLFAALSAWTTDGSVVRALLEALPSLTDAFIVWVKDRLGPGADPRFEVLGTQTIALLEAEKLLEQFDKKSPDLVGLQTRLIKLRADWRQHLGDMAPKVPVAELDDLVARSAWADAVRVVRQATARNATDSKIVQESFLEPHGSEMPVAAGLPAQRGSDLGLRPVPPPLLGTLEERVSLLDAAQRASKMQTLLLGALFVAGVYWLYQDTWTGSSKEMLALFMLAFSLDLTADSLAGAFKKLKMAEL